MSRQMSRQNLFAFVLVLVLGMFFCAGTTYSGEFVAPLSSKESSLFDGAGDPPFLPPPRFGVRATGLLRVEAEFSGLGRADPWNIALPLSPANQNRQYDNGYVRTDSSDNTGGTTWNWSYETEGQYNPDASTLGYNISEGLGDSRTRENDGPHGGFEVTWDQPLRRHSGGWFGLHASVSYTRIHLRDSGSLAGNVRRLTDVFALDGVIPPLAPYSGSFDGPGPLLGDTPTRSFQALTGASSITGEREAKADLLQFNLGPVGSWRLTDRLSFELGGGLSLAWVDSKMRIRETVTVTGNGSRNRRVSDSDSGFLFGAYIESGLTYQLTREWLLHGGFRYQYLGDFSQSAEGFKLTMDFKNSAIGFLGVSRSY